MYHKPNDEGIFHFLLTRSVNRLGYYFGRLCPIRKNLILMESHGDFTDNTQALYEYMRKNGFLKRYKVIWFADDPDSLMKYEDVQAVYKKNDRLNFRANYYKAVARLFLFSHVNVLGKRKIRKNQTVFTLWHGIPYKCADSDYLVNSERVLSTGNYGTAVLSRFLGREKEDFVVLGYPRTDYFFDDLFLIKKLCNQQFGFCKYKKVILWMPTFRRNKDKSVNEVQNLSETGLPILTRKGSFVKFNSFLMKENILFVLKVHPAQMNLSIFQSEYSNILILENADLQKMHIQLYQFIPLADALVSDYSSVAIDYMLLDKPIIFTLDDYEDYAKTRGFYPENAIDFMPGYHVCNKGEMEGAILEIADGRDIYREERQKLMPIMHKYTDGNSSRRVLDFLDINMN